MVMDPSMDLLGSAFLYTQYPFTIGWKYSTMVLIVLNSIAMFTVMPCYIVMFVSLSKGQKSLNASTANDRCVAKRMFALVATDAACWVPVIIIKILALAGVTFSHTTNG